MSRKVKEVPIRGDQGNRDLGKVFVLTELSAFQTESWGWRLYLAMARAGIEVPPEIAALGVAGAWLIGLRSLSMIGWHDAEPLLAEMMTCVRFKSGPDVVRDLMKDIDVEEWSTILKLREEIVELHLGFTIAEGLSKLKSKIPTAPTAAQNTSAPTSQD